MSEREVQHNENANALRFFFCFIQLLQFLLYSCCGSVLYLLLLFFSLHLLDHYQPLKRKQTLL